VSQKNGKAPISITVLHQASDEDEKKRVKENGGMVVWYSGGWRFV